MGLRLLLLDRAFGTGGEGFSMDCPLEEATLELLWTGRTLDETLDELEKRFVPVIWTECDRETF